MGLFVQIHLDMRVSGKYYGDETKGTSNVTSDFYAYFGVDKDALYKKYGLTVDSSAELEKTIDLLKKENDALRKENDALKGNIDFLNEKIDNAKKALQ